MGGNVWTREGWILVYGILALDVLGMFGAWLYCRMRSRRRRQAIRSRR